MLLRKIIKYCRQERGLSGPQLGITASTGLAAMNIGGSTLHAWAGIGLGTEDLPTLLINVLGKERFDFINGEQNRCDDYSDGPQGRPSAAERWAECQVLIIDESVCLKFCMIVCVLNEWTCQYPW